MPRGVPVALLFVVGEEVTHDGAHAANEAIAVGAVPRTSRVIINGEPTESTLAVGTKGAIRVTVRTAVRPRTRRIRISGTRRRATSCACWRARRGLRFRVDELLRRNDGEHRRSVRRRRGQRRRAVGRGAADDSARDAAGGGEVAHRRGGRRAARRSSGDRWCRRCGSASWTDFRRRSPHSRRTFPRSRTGGRRTCSVQARSTSRIVTTSACRIDELDAAVAAYEQIAVAAGSSVEVGREADGRRLRGSSLAGLQTARCARSFAR